LFGAVHAVEFSINFLGPTKADGIKRLTRFEGLKILSFGHPASICTHEMEIFLENTIFAYAINPNFY
jgi:hypothetical protein